MMNANDFAALVAARMDNCNKVLNEKGEEYSRGGDRLWNFKSAARKRNCTPEQALMGMKAKHDVSVDDIVDMVVSGRLPSKEALAEKFGDSINYLLLLEGLIEERRKTAEIPKKSCPTAKAVHAAIDKAATHRVWCPPSGFTLDVEEDC
jgi:hypothetical protein